MSAHFPTRRLTSGFLVAAGLLAFAHVSVAATSARIKYTPPYGDPFPGLEWFGEAEVTDGGCTKIGTVVNAFPSLLNGCNGKFSFVSATLSFSKISDPLTPLQTITFDPAQFGKVGLVERTSTDADDWNKVYSSAFRAVQGNIPQTLYDPDGAGGADPAQAWFSLVFVGSFAQVIWFKDDPGVPIFNSAGLAFYEGSAQYLGCYLLGPGEKSLQRDGSEINRCGLSSANNGRGSVLQISAVPEPQAYMMALVSLGVLGTAGSVSRRRKAKR